MLKPISNVPFKLKLDPAFSTLRNYVTAEEVLSKPDSGLPTDTRVSLESAQERRVASIRRVDRAHVLEKIAQFAHDPEEAEKLRTALSALHATST